ncbi:class Ib ribonucleoside-diphosphate reductase assembly flavoprotein NrdI [Gordonia sp. L191]|jgi:protein involved in ribonucleotide reduction|uniref:class Ib ribonucleoside-diphosphate reductase assembly flavoprotein NrdI n=1 Tax=Gordonia sp. L191 TaxID=2982699 RepID=UPI0024C03E7A|nr:class Ib ribonucleoside-diphosphate reductase assembly flavoprotein NrdI [Gordonia sp. L191]WHU48763.1 class Ib ribonucleoside-diphosphate reductase assembly flavoprotein NrdI [Gordonia sp. L191]
MTGTAPLVVYFSSVSENTHRFVRKLGLRSMRIPVADRASIESFRVDEPFVLICPTYGGGKSSSTAVGGGFVPKQVIKFLNNPDNRSWIRAVIAAGNTNFGEEFCLAGDIISRKCRVPYLYRFELMGTDHDVSRVREGLVEFAASPAFDRPDMSDPLTTVSR